MRNTWQLLIALFLVAVSSYGTAQEPPKPGKDDAKKSHEVEEVIKPELNVANVLKTSVTHLHRILLPLAMAMPENKYGFAPTDGEFKGVRTFGQQLKHVAATNFSYASSILGGRRREWSGVAEDPGRDPQIRERFVCLCAKGGAGDQREERSESHEESLWRGRHHAPGHGRSYHRPLLRSLWPDGGIRAHERYRAACKHALSKP